MWTTQPFSNALTVCWVKPTLYSSRTQTRRTSSISTRVFESNLVAKEIGVVVANIGQFGPTTNRFLESPAANEIAGFMFIEMHVKEQGLVKLRSKFALQGFHSLVSAATQSELSQSGSSGGTATIFRSHLAISHPFGSIPPGAAGFDWSSMTLLLQGTPVMFVSVYLTCNTGNAGTNLQKLSEIGSYVTNAGIPFVTAGDWNVLPSELLESSWPARIKGEILLPCDVEISCIAHFSWRGTFRRSGMPLLVPFAVAVEIPGFYSFSETEGSNSALGSSHISGTPCAHTSEA